MHYSTTFKGYEICFVDEASICLKLNNNYMTFFDAFKNNLIDDDLLYYIHCENADFFGFEKQERNDN